MKTIRKVFNSIIKDINVGERTLTALVSTGAKDRMDDILEPKGADLKNFNLNPVVLFAHDYSSPPIAKALWTKKKPEGVLSKMKFANTEFANEIFELYREGFMNAFSVGFIPKESEPVEENGSKYGPQRFLKWELLEYSAVPVPANPEALSLAVSKGIITEDRKAFLDKLYQKQVDDLGGEDEEEDNEEEELETEDEESNGSSSGELEREEKNIGLEDILAENELLEEKIVHMQKEISDLKYKLYVKSVVVKESKPEITVDNLADKFAEIVDGVIRNVQGKVN